MFLLFQTEEKPFPFKNNSSDEGTVIEAETEETDESEEASDDEVEDGYQEEKS